MNTQIGDLSLKDWLKGLVMAVITAVLSLVYQLLTSSQAIDYKQIGVVALTAALAYILKQLGTDENGNVLGVGSNK